MGDASFGSGEPGIGGDPNIGMDQGIGGDTGVGMDQGMGDPNMEMDQGMSGDPNMEMDQGPDTGGESFDLNPGGMDDTMQGGETENDAEFEYLKTIYSNLSPTDKDALISYGKSMDARDETNVEPGAEDVPEENPEQQPMMEVIFTKGQLNKINEAFGPVGDELNGKDSKRQNLDKKTTKTTSKKSPFNNPKFN